MVTASTYVLVFWLATAPLAGCDETQEADRVGDFDAQREGLVEDLRDLRHDIDELMEEVRTRMDEADDRGDEEWVRAYADLREARVQVDQAIGDAQRSTEETWNASRAYFEDLYARIAVRVDEWKRRL